LKVILPLNEKLLYLSIFSHIKYSNKHYLFFISRDVTFSIRFDEIK
jgi:hypothetical protein